MNAENAAPAPVNAKGKGRPRHGHLANHAKQNGQVTWRFGPCWRLTA
jgi:hypothetical protein